MKLHLTKGEGNFINSRAQDGLVINGERIARSVIVLPDRLLPWDAAANSLSESALEWAAQHAESGTVALLGAGQKSPPINAAWQAPFIRRGAALEIMSLAAACRTYNFLSADGRSVMAALALPSPACSG